MIYNTLINLASKFLEENPAIYFTKDGQVYHPPDVLPAIYTPLDNKEMYDELGEFYTQLKNGEPLSRKELETFILGVLDLYERVHNVKHPDYYNIISRLQDYAG